jgi:penicillin-binding protein 2D
MNFFKFLLILSLYLFIFLPSYSQDLPPINIKYSSYAVSENDELIGYFGEQNRVEVNSLSQLPIHVINALLATEDKEFYSHNGVSVKGLIRAAWKTVTGSKQGGSTLTMQLAKNLFLSPEQTLSRKFTEINLAMELEKKYSKEDILLLYLNTVYLGRGAYGIWAAAQEYFKKTPDKLSINEAAMIIGLLKSPSGYDPSRFPDKALKRRNQVLNFMVEYNKLTEFDCEKLKKQPLGLNLRENIAPHYLEHIRYELSNSLQKYGKTLNSSELKITTTLDLKLQAAAVNAVKAEWKQFPKGMQNAQIGLILMEGGTGKIRALIGGNPNSNGKGLNHALSIHRQPGSSFKPIMYASLLEKGYTLATPLLDSIIVVDSGKATEWRPMNDDDTYLGKYVPMKYVLQHSLNLASAHVIMDLTSPDSVILFAKRLGIESDIPAYPSIALGTGEVTPLEMACAFSVFQNYGAHSKPKTILKIEDKYKNTYYQYSPDTSTVLDSATCYLLTDALRAVVDSGNATSIRTYYKGPAAGKTGTTQNSTDAWFVGYTPNYTAAIWVGFDEQKNKLTGAFKYGGKVCAPIWGMMMNSISKFYSQYLKSDFDRPSKIIDTLLCTETGLPANENCPHKAIYPVNADKIAVKCQKH